MEDEAQKKNTDCVYFLASPLTCKKGSNCEYRHSEAARMNPRDCRYWLLGNCLNVNCSFRHPPLEGRASSNSATLASTASAPASGALPTISSAPVAASKSKTPCYFYSQGFCSKGDKCTFMHGLPVNQDTDVTAQQKPPKVPLSKGVEPSKPLLAAKKNGSTVFKYELQGPTSTSVPTVEPHIVSLNSFEPLQQVHRTSNFTGNSRMQEAHVSSTPARQQTEEGKARKAPLSGDRTRILLDGSKLGNAGGKYQASHVMVEPLPPKVQPAADNRAGQGLVDEDRKRNGYMSDGWGKETSSGFDNDGSDQSVYREEGDFSSPPHDLRGEFESNASRGRRGLTVSAQSQYEPSKRSRGQPDFYKGAYERDEVRVGHDRRGFSDNLARQQNDPFKVRSSVQDRQGKVAEEEYNLGGGDLRDHLTKRRKNDKPVYSSRSMDSHSQRANDAPNVHLMQRDSYFKDSEGSQVTSQRARIDPRIGKMDDKGVKRSYNDGGSNQEGNSPKRLALRISSSRQMIDSQLGGEAQEEAPLRLRSYLTSKGKTQETEPSRFAGPKSLAQIKAEKIEQSKHADTKSLVVSGLDKELEESLLAGPKSRVYSSANSETSSARDFEGPKSLSSLLKEKRKLCEEGDIQSNEERATKAITGSSSIRSSSRDKVEASSDDLSKDFEEGEVVPDSLSDGIDGDEVKNEVSHGGEEKQEGSGSKQLVETFSQDEEHMSRQQETFHGEEVVKKDTVSSDDIQEGYLDADDYVSGEEYELDEEDDDDNDFAKKLGGIFS